MEYRNQSDEVNQLLSMMDSKNEVIASLFHSLEESTVGLDTENLTPKMKYQVVIKTEFIIFRLRTVICNEQFTVKKILSSSSGMPVSLSSIFKNRDSFLASQIQRLNEIRDEAAVIQKLIYTYNNNQIK